jgi:hypothetical protein
MTVSFLIHLPSTICAVRQRCRGWRSSVASHRIGRITFSPRHPFSPTYGAAVVGDEAGLIRLRTRSNASRLAASNAVGIMKMANFRGLGLAPT